jgi:hypothetical protein
VSDIKGSTQTEGTSEKGAENTWNEEERNREEVHELLAIYDKNEQVMGMRWTEHIV